MKKAVPLFILFLAASFLFFSTRDYGEASQSPDIEIEEVTPYVYCCLKHKGPFSDIDSVIGQLMQFSRNQNVFPVGPLFGVFHNSPEDTEPENLMWEIGFPVTVQSNVQAPLEKKQWNFTLVVSSVHVGSYETVGETIAEMIEWMEDKGYAMAGPTLERYMDPDPSRISPSRLKTEIWIPCKKKE